MITFTITADQRHRAQARAADLDIGRTDPPGQYPYVWDNRQNSVKRWYDFTSAEDKIGTVYFEPVVDENGQDSGQVSCRTEITYRSLVSKDPRLTPLDDLEEHRWLAQEFLAELLAA